jgi:hypothetical protein
MEYSLHSAVRVLIDLTRVESPKVQIFGSTCYHSWRETAKAGPEETWTQIPAFFMIEGTETTATLLSSLVFLLLTNPSACATLTIKVLCTRAPLPCSIYLIVLPQCCIKEALFLYPPIPVCLLYLTLAQGSTNCNRFVPPGITVSASSHPYALVQEMCCSTCLCV